MQHVDKIELPHAVYKFYDKDEVLLYVGCSTNPFGGRLTYHGAVKPWAKDIVFAVIQWYPNWEVGARVEAQAILREDPKYNLAKVEPDQIGTAVLRRAGRRPRGDGLTCPRCGAKKEVIRPGKAYCNACYAEYRKVLRLQKRAGA